MNKNFEYTVAKSFLSEETVSLLSSEFGRAFDDPKANTINQGVVQFTANN